MEGSGVLWSFLLVLSGIVQFMPHNIKSNAIKAIQQSHSLTHPVKFLSPAMFPPNFLKSTVSSSATPSHWLGLSSQPSHLNSRYSCFVVNHSPCFTTPGPSSACPTECVFSNSVLSCLIVFAALITDKVDFQTLIGKGNFSVSL